MANSVQPVRGTRDYLPQEVRVRDAIKSVILRSYENNGFSKIQTPMLEDIDRLDKSDGGENLNMIFRILKRGQKLDLNKEGLTEKDLADMGLRFDLTLPLCRYFANNRAHLRLPFKVIQIGQVFRAERPQKGRLRQFYQCDIDIIGDSSPEAEIELIHTTAKTLMKLGFDDFTVRINDRRILFDMIESAGFPTEDVLSVCISFDKLDKIGIEGVKEELKEKGFESAAIERFIKASRRENPLALPPWRSTVTTRALSTSWNTSLTVFGSLGKENTKSSTINRWFGAWVIIPAPYLRL